MSEKGREQIQKEEEDSGRMTQDERVFCVSSFDVYAVKTMKADCADRVKKKKSLKRNGRKREKECVHVMLSVVECLGTRRRDLPGVLGMGRCKSACFRRHIREGPTNLLLVFMAGE